MKRTLIILLALLSLFVMSACNESPDAAPTQENSPEPAQTKQIKNPACADIANGIIASFGINMEDFDYYSSAEPERNLDEGTISLFYGSMESDELPDFGGVEDYYVLIPITTSATEMGVFKVSDAADAENLKTYFANRSSARASTFAPYDEAESEKARNAKIASEGNYVWYIMTDSNDEIEAKILEEVK